MGEQLSFNFSDDETYDIMNTEKDEDPNNIEVEVEDDTPPQDRGREPLPQNLKEELEKDDLEQYDDAVKQKLKQMKKVWHDERRAKEAAYREQQEAVNFARKLMEDNQRMKNVLDIGGKEYSAVLNNAAALEMEMAKRAYKEAYDNGDSDKLVEAQQAMQIANYKLIQAQNFRVPTLQDGNFQVQQTPQQAETNYQVNQSQLSPKLEAWQDRNPWYGTDDEMTASALGLHEKLKRTGDVVIGSDEYYAILDKTIRKRFPEYFHTGSSEGRTKAAHTTASTVVAPATRSTASNRIRLKASQIALAKRLGLTPEQYHNELRKLEA
jgi:hypothetical protein